MKKIIRKLATVIAILKLIHLYITIAEPIKRIGNPIIHPAPSFELYPQKQNNNPNTNEIAPKVIIRSLVREVLGSGMRRIALMMLSLVILVLMKIIVAKVISRPAQNEIHTLFHVK